LLLLGAAVLGAPGDFRAAAEPEEEEDEDEDGEGGTAGPGASDPAGDAIKGGDGAGAAAAAPAPPGEASTRASQARPPAASRDGPLVTPRLPVITLFLRRVDPRIVRSRSTPS
jgi:hypothetical protein